MDINGLLSVLPKELDPHTSSSLNSVTIMNELHNTRFGMKDRNDPIRTHETRKNPVKGHGIFTLVGP